MKNSAKNSAVTAVNSRSAASDSGRVVLAYSGGLDTSVGIGWLGEATGKEVVALAIDVGQGGEDLSAIQQRALDCGAVESLVVDARDEFANNYVLPAVQANALYQKRYPLVSALSRPLIARHLVRVARELGADTVAHGCTGKGNDQVRFEAAVYALAPELHCVAPIRDLALTRDKAIEYAERNRLPIAQSKKNPYSVDQNLWGRAVETGFLEDLWNAPTEDVYSYTSDPAAADEPVELILGFERGLPTSLNGQSTSMRKLIEVLNQLAGAQGVGRIDLVEDRLVGIKSREVYESPAGAVLIAAHEELENVTLEREQLRFKRLVEVRWAELVYDGLWFSGLKDSLDAFIAHTQRYVSGEIRLVLHRGVVTVTGRRSPSSLYDYSLATYDTGDSFDQSLARGFVELWSLPGRLAARRNALAEDAGNSAL